MKKKAERCLALFNKKSRMFKPSHWNCLLKRWNNGMGLLETIKLYPEEKIILVNSALWTKRDERVLQSILAEMDMEDWSREVRFYGYPRYYNEMFGLHLSD